MYIKNFNVVEYKLGKIIFLHLYILFYVYLDISNDFLIDKYLIQN